MRTYKFSAPIDGRIETVDRFPGEATIPLNMDNRDHVQFLKDWESGAEVLNADGSPAPYSDEAAKALGLGPT